ncbi:30S ribosomal protein S17 [Phycisphaerae bacterium RAS1]|nr:30S ribosomal protein S17 [Phycisphaerae bacterium RAS1]
MTVPGQATVTPDRQERNERPTRVGVVSAAGRAKTVRVTIAFSVKHAKYGKYMRRGTHLQVHDEANDARLGDTVEIVECRPISKTKRWRLVKVLQRAPEQVQLKPVGGDA